MLSVPVKKKIWQYDAVTHIYIQDESGNDLLNPDNLNGFKLEDIRFEFYHDEGRILHSGQFEINNPVIYAHREKGYWLWLSPSATQERTPEDSWLRIYWPDHSVDTLDFEVYDDHQNVIAVTKVYLNKVQVWPDPMNNPEGLRNITIIK